MTHPSISSLLLAPYALLALACGCPAASWGQSQDLSIDERIAAITAQFQEAYDRDVAQPHAAAVTDLDAKYASALKRALESASSDGKLDEALKLREETERLSTKEPLPPVDLDSLPDSLKQLRSTYRAALAKLEADRDSKAQPFYDHYDKLLGELQDELTQAQKLDEALAVKAKREAVALDRPKSVTATPEPAMAATIPTPDPVSPTPSPTSATPTASSPWRAAAEWVLSLKGSVFVDKDESTRMVDKLSDLPPGKFDILQVIFHERKNHDGAKMTDADLTRLNPIAKTLREVHLSKCAINGSGLEALAGATELQELYLAESPITDDALRHLKDFASLQLLDLNRTQITGVGLTHLVGLPNLKTLFLAGDAPKSNARFTAEGYAALGRLVQLEQLEVANHGFDGTALLQNVGALVNLKRLQVPLHTTDAQLAGLTRLTKLEEFSSSNVPEITGTGFIHLKASGNTLKQINMGYNGAASDSGVETIVSCFPNLENLSLGYDSTCGTKSVQALAKLSNLKFLRWWSTTPLTDEDYAHFATLPALESLGFSTVAITDGAIAQVAQCKGVTNLTLSDKARITDAALGSLKSMKSLRTLNLNRAPFTDAGIADFKKTRPDVKVTP